VRQRRQRIYRVDLASRKVERQIRNLPPEARARIIEAIKSLAQNPRPYGVEKIKGHYHRIRIGDYRVVYAILEKEKVVVIAKVARRGKETYKEFR